MNASEITVGQVVAATEGSGRYERSDKAVSKVEVLTPAKGGYVEVEFLEVGGRGFRRYSPTHGYVEVEAGQTRRIPTRSLWMDWSTYETRLANLKRQRDEKDAEQARIDAALADIQQRLDQFAGEVDEKVEWAGYRHQDLTTDVKVPKAALLALLDRAEGK
jgi:hypothetical protein